MNPFVSCAQEHTSYGHRTRPAIASERICRIRSPELVPLGDNRQRVGALDGIIATCSIRDPRAEDAFGYGAPRIERLHLNTGRQQSFDQGNRRASRMSSVRGLNASPQTPTVFPLRLPKCSHHREELRLLTLFTSSTAPRIVKSYSFSAAKRRIAWTSFGKQLPP